MVGIAFCVIKLILYLHKVLIDVVELLLSMFEGGTYVCQLCPYRE
jgi:hypothetical protein